MSAFEQQLDDAVSTLAACRPLAPLIDEISSIVADGLLAGRRLFSCGNGGSAADAMHLTEELIGRYRANRRAFPAVCLNSDVGALTCIANDFGYEYVFSRQLSGLGSQRDLLVVFSTSGNSLNINHTLSTARALGMTSIALLGKDGGEAAKIADHALIVPSNDTARIQEVHTLILHAFCEAVEQRCS
jgi:D-sedoheptulose 7-phosphate isomerase